MSALTSPVPVPEPDPVLPPLLAPLLARALAARVVLAPMAGITDRPMRDLVARFGVGMVVSEMVGAPEMLSDRRGTRDKMRPAPGVVNSVQIAGREAGPMAEAARMAVDLGAPLIDINMGCPAKKVTSGASGSALMKEPDLALRLIDAVVAAVEVPVTLKMRLGWDSLTAPDLARRAEAAGVRMITVHGRTRAQFYKGQADWHAVRQVRAATRLPLLVNGDIVDAQTARAALDASGADAVMIGRGVQGHPWRPAQIMAALTGTVAPTAPSGPALGDLIIGHYEEMLRFYGPKLGLRVARKHLGWYLAPHPGGEAMRTRLMRLDSPAQVCTELRAFFASYSV